MREKLYLSVYANIKKDIINGAYKNGQKLLSKRVLAERFGVSVITVEHSLDILYNEGYIIPKERSGFYVSYINTDGFLNGANITHNNVRGENIITNQGFPYSVYVKTVRRVLSDYQEEVLNATSYKGLFELRKAISDYLKRSREINVSPERIIIGSGSEYLYGLIVRTLGLDKTIAIETPSYKQIENVYRSYGVKLEYLKLGSGGIDTEDLENASAQVLHVSPFRSFPTGISATVSKKLEYIEWAKKRNGFIIEDDFESEFSVFAKPVETVFSFDNDDRTVYLNTFSKTISPSVRTGYMILPERLAEDFEQNVGFYRCTVPSLDQLVIAQLLNCGEFERHVNKQRRLLRKGL